MINEVLSFAFQESYRVKVKLAVFFVLYLTYMWDRDEGGQLLVCVYSVNEYCWLFLSIDRCNDSLQISNSLLSLLFTHLIILRNNILYILFIFFCLVIPIQAEDKYVG